MCKYCNKTLYTKDFAYFAINTKVYRYNKVTTHYCPVCGKPKEVK